MCICKYYSTMIYTHLIIIHSITAKSFTHTTRKSFFFTTFRFFYDVISVQISYKKKLNLTKEFYFLPKTSELEKRYAKPIMSQAIFVKTLNILSVFKA